MTRTISTGELRQRLADMLNQARYAKDRIIVERNGKPIAAIISLEDLQTYEALEDATDIAAADAAKAEKGGKPLEEFLRELESEADEGS